MDKSRLPPDKVILDLVLRWGSGVKAIHLDPVRLLLSGKNHRGEPFQQIIAPHFDGEPEDGPPVRFRIYQLGSSVWKISPSLLVPTSIHAYLTLVDVPDPAPWSKAQPQCLFRGELVMKVDPTLGVARHSETLELYRVYATGDGLTVRKEGWGDWDPEPCAKPSRASEVQLGCYTHFKGGKYTCLGVARLVPTSEELVLYVSETGLWLRPIDSFLDWVEVVPEGAKLPLSLPHRRFRYDGVYR